MSSMWKVPPAGRRRTRAFTTLSASEATSSRILAEAAPWPPLTARNALVSATEIFDGSKPTTAPLRRITLYWENGDSELLAETSESVALGRDGDVVVSAAMCIYGLRPE